MSDYKTELQSNNVDLQVALDLVRTLPDKGVEVESVECTFSSSRSFKLIYTNTKGEIVEAPYSTYGQKISDIMKGSVCCALQTGTHTDMCWNVFGNTGASDNINVLYHMDYVSSASLAKIVFVPNIDFYLSLYI